ncbi:hypothetical protein C8A05DRAFT_12364, partial [Staphylotrichum tortipilum]
MTQLLLGAVFGELGISQYLDAFLEQGFDTWETILDITESDLDALGVKLGHRRKLQRRIANSRGIAPEASLVSPTQSSAEDLKLQQQDAVNPEPAAVEAREPAAVVVTKRKYRRHPKPDDNAPERPPSAYVLFSNKMREELKGRNLSFTEIAKLVGENWQNLSAAEKEPFESQAQAIKDKYLSDLASYKKTGEYRKYMTYLQEFKTKHASPSQDKDASKRLRLSEPSAHGRGSPGATPTRTSRSGSGADSRKGSEPPTSRQRVDSNVSAGESQFAVSLGPPGMASPDEPVLSPVISESDRHSAADLSPVMKPEPREHQPMLAAARRHPGQGGEDQARDQMNVHRHLPSLSDVFDGQGLPGGMRPSIEPSGGYRFPGALNNPEPPANRPGSDSRPPPVSNGHPYPPTNQHSFGPPRPAVDGPLPIHALLASKPEPTFHTHQQPQPPQHIHPYHHDQKPRLAPPNG